MSTTRERFEAHMRKLNACTRFERQSEAVGGNYRTVSVERAWQLWQAAERATAERCVAWCDELKTEKQPFSAENNGRGSDFAFGCVCASDDIAGSIKTEFLK